MSAGARGAAAAAGTLTGLILLIGAKSGGPTAARVALPAGAAGAGASPSTQTTRPQTASSPAGPPSAGPSPASAAAVSQVVTGPAVDVRYGFVQVRVTLRAGRIVDVSAVQLPSDRSRSRAISNYVAPVLSREALAAQGAQIDSISGASYTSEGYVESLQAALDQARAGA